MFPIFTKTNIDEMAFGEAAKKPADGLDVFKWRGGWSYITQLAEESDVQRSNSC